MDNYSQLRKNLGRYLSKFYLNELLKGILVSALIGGITWLGIILLEYFGQFEKGPRTAMFFAFVAIAGTLFISQVLVPLAKFFGLLKRKDDSSAAKDIGRKISAVDDRLSNLLSLEEKSRSEQNALIKAGINQKSAQLNQHDFRTAVDLKDNLRWLRYLAIPILILIAIWAWEPDILREGSKRIVSFNEDFVPAAPFQFVIENNQLNVAEGEDYTLRIKTTGSQLPDFVFIEMDGSPFRMKKISEDAFEFGFQDVRKSIEFKLSGGGFFSPEYKLNMLPIPKVLRNTALITYPDYTRLGTKKVSNQSQMKVPEGSKITWAFDLKNVQSILVKGINSTVDGNHYQFEETFYDSEKLSLIISNNQSLVDSATLQVNVEKDQHPMITASEMVDSNSLGIRYFNGELKDDYGFTKLQFHAEISGKNQSQNRSVIIPLDVQKSMNEQSFSFLWSLDTLQLLPEESITYYFEVWDNDGINGAKKSSSQQWSYEVPSVAELDKQSSEQADKTKDALDQDQSDLQDMQKDLEQLKKDLLEKKKPDWEEKEKLQELLEKQQQMMEQLKQKTEQQQKQNAKDNQFKQYPEELMQKQKQIEEMFEKLFDDEFKQKYEEWQKLMEEFNKTDMLEKIDEMELDNEKLEKELDRTLELFKELEFEKKVEDVKQKAEELAEKQDALNEKTEDKSNESESLKEEQSELQKELDQLKDDLKKLDELNEDLENPKDLPELQEEQQKASQQMEESKENLNKNNRNKSQENQQKASDELKKMGDKLDNFQQEQEDSQSSENLDDMRQLMENIVDLSHSQEEIMNELKNTSLNDPQYVGLAKRQKDLIDDTKIVEDSLLALSKRVPQIERTINDEITEVKSNMQKALQNMTDQLPNQERKFKAMAASNQQFAMTSLNNLANLFDEIMKNMQNQMMQDQQGKGECKKPGNKPGAKPGEKSSASDLRKMQQNLNKQLEQLKKAMEEGKNPNGKKPGQQSGSGMGGGKMSESLAKMAAEQAAIREQLRQMSESLGKEGQQPGSGIKQLEEMMERTEEDILFQNITQETLRRQQEIITKLLESEKAEREREQDKKRESQNPNQEFNVPQDVWENYLKQKEKELELYQTLPPNLKPFYRNKVNRYLSKYIIQ